MAQLSDALVNGIFDRVLSWPMTLGRFESVNQHEPKSSPGTGMSYSQWVQEIRPVGKMSGLQATTGVLILQGRIYMPFLTKPYDFIDPQITSATADFMGALSGDFDFDVLFNVRNVDLLGSSGVMLRAIAGYVEINREMYRVMTITIPIIVNDMFLQGS